MKEMSVTQKMRCALVPGGTLPVVKLHLNNHGYVNHDLILRCLDEIDKLPMKQALGEPLSELERLAIMLLMDSAYIELPKKD
jgi:hypothetical protein